MVRVYVPLDPATLEDLRRRGEIGPVPVRAHAARMAWKVARR